MAASQEIISQLPTSYSSPDDGSAEKASALNQLHERQDQQPSQTHSRDNMRSWAWVLVLISIITSLFLYALDNTIVANIQPTIVQDLGEIDKLPWISVSFAFAAASVQLLWGKIFMLFENKTAFLVAVFVFEAGTAVCGAARTMNALIVGRTLCGLGASGIYIGSVNLVSLLTTIQERPTYLGLTGLTWGAGTVLVSL